MNKHLILLAAGNSRRFGSNKLLHFYEGKPLFHHILETTVSFCSKREDCTLYVVSQYKEILEAAASFGVKTVESPDSKKGLSYTIRAALHAIAPIREEDFVVFIVADQPHLTEHTLEMLLQEAKDTTETASVKCGDQPGNPTMFSARLLPELLALKEDEGGRNIIKKHTCNYVQVEDSKELYDIDTPKQKEVEKDND